MAKDLVTYFTTDRNERFESDKCWLGTFWVIEAHLICIITSL